MPKFLYALTVIGSIVGSFFLIGAFLEDSAPKQAASAGIAVALAVVPYCLARASSALSNSESISELKCVNDTLATHTRLLAALANAAEPIEASEPR